MSSCCSNTKIDLEPEKVSEKPITSSSSENCPACIRQGRLVSIKTLYHHLKQPWQLGNDSEPFYFCENTTCQVVYFSKTKQILNSELRHSVSKFKEEKTLCYCFNISVADYLETPCLLDFVVEKTKAKDCACDVQNPSGRCCLKDFKKVKSV